MIGIPELALWQWLVAFVALAAVLVRASVTLARAGDEIATRSGLGGLLVGMLMMAGATSLPEIATDVSAAVAGAPDLAVGDLFGSSMANMAILALIDLWHRGRVWLRVEVGHARVGSAAIGLTAVAVLGMITPQGVALGWVGLDTLLVGLGYVAAVAWFRRSPIPRGDPETGSALPAPTGWADAARSLGGVRDALVRFGSAALVILVSAPFVVASAQGITQTSRLDGTFVGVSFLAMATSLAELVASFAAVRVGAYDLAVGNLFGSNALNMSILVLVDIAYTPGPVLSAVGPSAVVAGVAAMLMMALAQAAIVHGRETRVRRLEPDAVLLLVAYLGGLAAVWAS